jgi:hypothetical protein
MIVAVLQALATAAAGVALFHLWRAALPAEVWLRRVVAAGFLARAVAGQALFWISWARLPLLPHLQAGNGLWFFGVDGELYFANAVTAASDGLAAIARVPPQAALVYVQLLAAAVWLFGAVTSAGLLINLFCYLGCVALLRRWTNAAIAITAISISPAFILWSLQPLKDPLFQLLVVAFVCACAAWQRAWTQAPRWRNVAALAALLAVVLAALSGVRWYVAFALLIAALPFLFTTALRACERRGVALGTAAAVALLLVQALLAGGRGQVPRPIVALLTPSTSFGAMANLPSLIAGQVGGARDAFEQTGGSTAIQVERRPSNGRSVRRAEARRSTPADGQVREVVGGIVDGWNRGDVEAVVANFDDTPDVEIWNDGKRTAAGPEQVRDVYGALAAATEREAVRIAGVRTAIDGSTATASGQWQRESHGRRRSGSVTFVLRRTGGGWRVVRQTTDTRSGGPQTPGPSGGLKPAAPLLRLAAGAGAIVVPRVVGEGLGLFHIGGGRGFLWLADVDTLVFDLALIVSIAVIATRFRAARRDPLVWMLAILTLLIGVPLAYSVTNFGTLFRLRETVYLGIILAPAAAIAAAARDVADDGGP